MDEAKGHVISIDFPGDIEYIPPVRKFISRIINIKEFSRRFAFRTEIIIDELCNNAVKFGKLKISHCIHLKCNIQDDEVILDICNPGSSEKDVMRLKKFIESDVASGALVDFKGERGIKIIKILCQKMEVVEGDLTCVRITKKKNENEDL